MNRRNSVIWIDSDILSGFSSLATELNFSAESYLERHSVTPTDMGDGRKVVSFQSFANLLEDVAASQRCSDFGFRLARAQLPMRSGMVSQLMLVCPTIGDALRQFIKFQHLYSESVRWTLFEHNGIWFMRRLDSEESTRAKPQLVLFSITLSIKGIRSIIGSGWKPRGVYFDNDYYEDLNAIRRFYDAPVFVNTGFNEIAFSQSDLNLPIATHNPTMLQLLTRYFESLSAAQETTTPIADRARAIIRANLDERRFSIESVARELKMRPRSLQRALAKENISFRNLLASTRLDVANHLLINTKMNVSEISEMLGYANTSAFSRAFTKVSGRAPSQKR